MDLLTLTSDKRYQEKKPPSLLRMFTEHPEKQCGYKDLCLHARPSGVLFISLSHTRGFQFPMLHFGTATEHSMKVSQYLCYMPVFKQSIITHVVPALLKRYRQDKAQTVHRAERERTNRRRQMLWQTHKFILTKLSTSINKHLISGMTYRPKLNALFQINLKAIFRQSPFKWLLEILYNSPRTMTMFSQLCTVPSYNQAIPLYQASVAEARFGWTGKKSWITRRKEIVQSLEARSGLAGRWWSWISWSF